MAWYNSLKDLTHDVAHPVVEAAHTVGKVQSNPWVQGLEAAALASTGVGAPASAAIMGANKGIANLIKPGGNLKSAATGVAQGAATGAGASLGGSAIKALAGKLGFDPSSAIGKLGGLVKEGGSDLLGLGEKFLGGGVGSSGSGGIMDKLLGAGAVGAAAADKLRQEGLQNKGINYATGEFDANAPLRDRARAMVQDDSTPDLSSIFANSGNVYDRQRRGMPPLTTKAPAAAAMTGGNALTGALMNRVPAGAPATAPMSAPATAPMAPPSGAMALLNRAPAGSPIAGA
jgi:hypothetical protein